MDDLNYISLLLNNNFEETLNLKKNLSLIRKNSKYVIFYHNSYLKINNIHQRYFLIFKKNIKNQALTLEKINKINIEFKETILNFLVDEEDKLVFWCKEEYSNYMNKIYIFEINENEWFYKNLENLINSLKGFSFFNYDNDYYGIHGGYYKSDNKKLFSNYNNNFIFIDKKNFNISSKILINGDYLPFLINHQIILEKDFIFIIGGTNFKTLKENRYKLNNKLYKVITNLNENFVWKKFQSIKELKGLFNFSYDLIENILLIFGGYNFKDGIKKPNKYLIQFNLLENIYKIYKVNLLKKSKIKNGFFFNEKQLFLIIKHKKKYILKNINFNFLEKENSLKLNKKSKNKLENIDLYNCKNCKSLQNINMNDYKIIIKKQKELYFFNNYLFKNFDYKNILTNSLNMSNLIVYPFIPFRTIINIFNDSKKIKFNIKEDYLKISIFSTQNISFLKEIISNKNSFFLEQFKYILSNLFIFGNQFTWKLKKEKINILKVKISNLELWTNLTEDFLNWEEEVKLVIIINDFNSNKYFKIEENNIFLINNYFELPNNWNEYLKLQLNFYNEKFNLKKIMINNYKIYTKNNKISLNIFKKSNNLIKYYYFNKGLKNQNYSIITIYNKSDFIKYLTIKFDILNGLYNGIIFLNDLEISYFNNKISYYLIMKILSELKNILI